MKFMISQPMAGKTQKEIYDERATLVQSLGEMGHTVADTVITAVPPADNNAAIWCLAHSILWMSACDGVYFMPGWEKARGCRVEHAIAAAYGRKIFLSLDEVKEATGND